MITMEQNGLSFTEVNEIPERMSERKKYGSWVDFLYAFIQSGVKCAVVEHDDRYTVCEVYNRLNMASRQSFKQDGIRGVMRKRNVYLINESDELSKAGGQ